MCCQTGAEPGHAEGHAAFAEVVLQLLFQLGLSCSEVGLCLSTRGEGVLTPWS